jgi:hypothetical protein
VKAPLLLVILDEARTGSYNCGVLNSNVTVVLYHFPGTVNIPRQNLMNYESTFSFSVFFMFVGAIYGGPKGCRNTEYM